VSTAAVIVVASYTNVTSDSASPRMRRFAAPLVAMRMSGAPSLLTSATTTPVAISTVSGGSDSAALMTIGCTDSKSLSPGLR